MAQDRVGLLQNMPIFGGIRRETLLFLLSLARLERFAKGGFLCKEGEPGESMMVLEKGTVAVIKQWKGKEYLLGSFLGAGDCVGEMSLIDLQPRSASVVAMDDCEAICLESGHFYQLHKKDLAQFTTIQLNIAREVCRRLRATDQQLFETQMEANLIDGEFYFHR